MKMSGKLPETGWGSIRTAYEACADCFWPEFDHLYSTNGTREEIKGIWSGLAQMAQSIQSIENWKYLSNRWITVITVHN